MRILQQTRGLSFGNSLFGKQDMDVKDRIEQKKFLHQKNAMHLVTTADRGEKRLDKTVEDHRGQIRALMEENEEYDAFYQDYKKKMAQAKEDYEIEDDSQEQKDLELLQKDFDKKFLTEEEEERLKEIKKNMTDYQKLSMEYYAPASDYKRRIEVNNLKLVGESAVIRKISVDRLKEHGMVDAQEAKDKILETASKEIMGMLVEDAKENMDERADEIKEAADKREEKKEETEERIQAAKDNKMEAVKEGEEIRESVKELSKQVTGGEEVMQDINQEIKKVMREQKLLEEELKGLIVSVEG